jgi:hypothetical protein
MILFVVIRSAPDTFLHGTQTTPTPKTIGKTGQYTVLICHINIQDISQSLHFFNVYNECLFSLLNLQDHGVQVT